MGYRLFCLCEQVLNLVTKIDCKLLRWEKPEGTYYKLNTYGIKLRNGSLRAGGICRDANKNIIMAFASPLGNESSNYAKVMVALRGLKWCTQNDINNLILEGDSLLIIIMLNGKAIPIWQLKDVITETRDLAKRINCQF